MQPERLFRLLALGAALSLAASGPAFATSTIFCNGDNDSGLMIGIGSVPGAAVISAVISSEGQTWSLQDGDLAVSQAFADFESFRVDFTDANISEVVARVRLFRAEADDDVVMAGTLQIVDVGAYAVSCEGP